MSARKISMLVLNCLLAVCMLSCADSFAQASIKATIVPANCNGGTGGAITVVVSGSYQNYRYSWSNGASTAEISNLVSGTYTLELQADVNLDTLLTFAVPENTCELYVPLVFTPNGDGIQDDWRIINAQFYPDLLVLVYNRWGQQVYQHQGTFTSWDGKSLLGTPLDEATYYYIIYKDSKNQGEGMLKGSVTIVR